MNNELKINIRFKDEHGNAVMVSQPSPPEKVLLEGSIALGLLGLGIWFVLLIMV